MDVIRHIRELMPRELNFLEVDHFLHIVSATEEGINAVKYLKGGGGQWTQKKHHPEIIETISQILQERKDMKKVLLEKYLEGFIEGNFDKIGFIKA